MRFDDLLPLGNPARAEDFLHHRLLSYNHVPGRAEELLGISRFWRLGWKQYQGSSLYVSFTKTTPETTLVAEMLIVQCHDDPLHLDSQAFISAPDGTVLEFTRRCNTYAAEIERTIMGEIECYISRNPRSAGQEFFRRYRTRTHSHSAQGSNNSE